MFQRGDERPQNPDTILIAQDMHDPAEEIDICAFHGLLVEEIVPLEANPVAKRCGEEFASFGGRLWEILHDEFHVRSRGGKSPRNGAMASPHINKRNPRAIESGPIVPGNQVLEIPTRISSHKAHTGSESSGPLRVLRQKDEGGKFGLVCKTKSRLVRFLGAGVEGKGFHGAAAGRSGFACHSGDPIWEFRVLDHEARDSRMLDLSRRGLDKDVVRHSVFDQARE